MIFLDFPFLFPWRKQMCFFYILKTKSWLPLLYISVFVQFSFFSAELVVFIIRPNVPLRNIHADSHPHNESWRLMKKNNGISFTEHYDHMYRAVINHLWYEKCPQWCNAAYRNISITAMRTTCLKNKIQII